MPQFTRRSLLVAASALPAGCTVQNPPPPPTPTGQLAPDQPLSLAAGEGVVVGLGLMVYAAEAAKWRRDTYGRSRRLVLVTNASRDPLYIPLARTTVNMVRTDDGAVAVEAAPFAFKLPAGQARVVGQQVYDLVSYTLHSNRPADRQHAWLSARLPPLGFNVVPGEVTYVGRLGWLDGRVSFPSSQALDTACPQRQRVSNFRFQDCLYAHPIFGSDLDADLEPIRRGFPSLGDRPVRRNGAVESQGWEPWPAILSNPPSVRSRAGAT